MFWNRSISSLEQAFFLFFLLIYAVYIIKVLYVARKMQVTNRAVFLKIIPRLLTFGLLLAALLEPTFGFGDESTTAQNGTTRDNLILLDISRSMEAKDIAPNRLLKSKNEIKKVIDNFPNDRFGLICFASEAHLVSPLSIDKSNIFELLKNIKSQSSTNQGTNLKEALDLAITKHINPNNSKTSAKTIVVYTDGEDFSDLDDKIFNDLRRNQIKLILVGIGSPKGDYIIKENGEKVTDQNNNEVITKLQTDYLETLAQRSNGVFINTYSTEKAAQKLQTTLENHRSNGAESYFNTLNNANKYQYALIIALSIVLLDILFSIRIFEF
jgi:Ca-activated chloride channel homolog